MMIKKENRRKRIFTERTAPQPTELKDTVRVQYSRGNFRPQSEDTNANNIIIIAIIKHHSPAPSPSTPMTKRSATQPNDNDRINDNNDNKTLTEAKVSK